ncbi:polyadenylate-binding protein-interacting protein 9-like [Hibiscus syriacus]|uniref:polyadenylate-binding protein-interacting protein 9-like n=1 Tax=Hibiscus syriacus TaxID=106335 RepID=UPI001923D859|nr:polyadenylate-binding protein-interacting protein 9-like [Hibiscus syriacus]
MIACLRALDVHRHDFHIFGGFLEDISSYLHDMRSFECPLSSIRPFPVGLRDLYLVVSRSSQSRTRAASTSISSFVETELDFIGEGRNNDRGKRKLNGKAFQAQRDDTIRRTVYVSDIDQSTTEEQLAGLFSNCGQVVDCRVCGDPNSVLCFAFVEFADEEGARVALNLDGTMLGFYPVKVLPSKTAILPVNPTFLPKSEDEREMCARTVYCTNIDKEVSQAEVKNFFESACGEVTRLRILGDNVHSTRNSFVEFAMAESAIVALSCSGLVLGTQPIRASPSKTPVRPQLPDQHRVNQST